MDGAAGGGQPGSHDLLVVGPGVLGSLAGKLWLESFPDATVVGQTNTTASHDRCALRACADCEGLGRTTHALCVLGFRCFVTRTALRTCSESLLMAP